MDTKPKVTHRLSDKQEKFILDILKYAVLHYNDPHNEPSKFEMRNTHISLDYGDSDMPNKIEIPYFRQTGTGKWEEIQLIKWWKLKEICSRRYYTFREIDYLNELREFYKSNILPIYAR